MAHSAHARPKRPLFVTVLATVALLVGIVVAFVTAQTAARVVRMRAWPTVPATLESVELHLAPGTTRRARSVAARYHYAVDGQTYPGTQVSVYAPDSVGSFFDRIYQDLRGHLDRHETVPVHVNPASPSEAVLLPVWRPEVLLFEAVLMLVFGGGGWGLLAGRIGPWRLSPEESDDDGSAPSQTDAPDSDTDAPPVDMNERLPSAEAWARRWLLLGIVVFAADFVLIDYSRGDSYLFIDRLLATQVVATATIGASEPPPSAVEAAFARARGAVGGDAQLVLDRQRQQGPIYTLSVQAANRSEALAKVDTLLAGINREYRAQSGRDLDSFRDAYVAPLRTPELFRRRMLIVGGLFAAGLACVAAWWWLSRRTRK